MPNDVAATPLHRVVRQRFVDQCDADEVAIKFIEDAALRLRDEHQSYWTPFIEWWNLEGDDGRVGVVKVQDTTFATVTVLRDQMNFSEVCGFAFV